MGSPELVLLVREMNLSTEVKLDTKTIVPTPKYEPTYEDQEDKKKARDEKYIKSVSLGEMVLPTKVNADYDTKTKVPSTKGKHTHEYEEDKKKAKKEKKLKKKTKEDNDDSDYDIVIESVTYV